MEEIIDKTNFNEQKKFRKKQEDELLYGKRMIVNQENFDEVKYREKLNRKFSDGAYQIGYPPYTVFTGKGGKVEFELTFMKEALKQGYTFEFDIYE
jgi:hypothetical protein